MGEWMDSGEETGIVCSVIGFPVLFKACDYAYECGVLTGCEHLEQATNQITRWCLPHFL